MSLSMLKCYNNHLLYKQTGQTKNEIKELGKPVNGWECSVRVQFKQKITIFFVWPNSRA